LPQIIAEIVKALGVPSNHIAMETSEITLPSLKCVCLLPIFIMLITFLGSESGPQLGHQPEPGSEQIPNQLELLRNSYSELNDNFRSALDLVVRGMKILRGRLNKNSSVFGARDSGLYIPVKPAAPVFDRLTKLDEFFPVGGLEILRGNEGKEVKLLQMLTFEEKALMSSITIERNEIYHDVYQKLHELQSDAVKEVISRGYSPVTEREDFLDKVESSIASMFNSIICNLNSSNYESKGTALRQSWTGFQKGWWILKVRTKRRFCS
jgi:hypothetical protein